MVCQCHYSLLLFIRQRGTGVPLLPDKCGTNSPYRSECELQSALYGLYCTSFQLWGEADNSVGPTVWPSWLIFVIIGSAAMGSGRRITSRNEVLFRNASRPWVLCSQRRSLLIVPISSPHHRPDGEILCPAHDD